MELLVYCRSKVSGEWHISRQNYFSEADTLCGLLFIEVDIFTTNRPLSVELPCSECKSSLAKDRERKMDFCINCSINNQIADCWLCNECLIKSYSSSDPEYDSIRGKVCRKILRAMVEICDMSCDHTEVTPGWADQTLAVVCMDCDLQLAVCWMDDHISECLWNQACLNDANANRCEHNRVDVCAICSEIMLAKKAE